MKMNIYPTSTAYETEFWDAIRLNRAVNADRSHFVPFMAVSFLPERQAKVFRAALEKESIFRTLGTVLPMPQLENTVRTVTSEAEPAWVADGEVIPEDEDILAEYRFQMYKLAAIAKVHEDLLEDKTFDFQSFLLGQLVQRFARAEEKAFLVGNGIGQPTGVLTDQGGGEIGVMAESPSTIAYDEVVTLFHSLESKYREKAVWLMNDETAIALRKAKDDAGNRLWEPGEEKLLGKPVVISNAVPGIEAGMKPLVIGDLSYYWIIERIPLAVRALYEKYVLKQFRGYVGYEHLDGKLIRPDAVKVLKMAE